MATIRKRTWSNRDGSTSTAYVLGYQDRAGEWVRRQFSTRAEANAERVRIESELARGAHVADRSSMTVGEALRAWMVDFEQLVERGRRERSTLDAYRTLAGHIERSPIRARLLSRLTPPDVEAFAEWADRDLTAQQAPRSLGLLRQVLSRGVRLGWCAINAAAEVRIREAGDRHDEALTVPTKAEIRRLLEAAEADGPRTHAMVLVAALCGLRSSELRGLRRSDVGTETITVAQRADRYQRIGAPKSRHSRRSVPLPPAARRALALWMLQAPHSDLAFPSRDGGLLSYTMIWDGAWKRIMRAAELMDGTRPRFGWHMLRHVAVSLWIEQGADPKLVSTWAGHHSVAFTYDTYGHLWQQADRHSAIASGAERTLLG